MAKICGICGQDCGDRPRVKDRRGRYYCKSCAMVAAARPDAVAGDESGASSPRAEPYSLELDASEPAPSACPVCDHPHAPGARVCTYCGYNEGEGLMSSRVYRKALRQRGKDRGPRCRECGYSLVGLSRPICPECGSTVSLAPKSDLRAEIEREVIRREWIKPAAWLGVGFTGMLIASGAVLGVRGLIGYPVMLILEVLLGYGMLWVCFSFIGDVGTPLLNLLRLAGIYALVDLIGVVAGLIPILFIPWAITLLCYVGLFSDAFETDWHDAFLVIILTGFLKAGVFILLAYYGLGL